MPPFGPKMTEELRKCRALANALDNAVDDLGLRTNRGEGSVSSIAKLKSKSGARNRFRRDQLIPTTTQLQRRHNGSAAGRDVGERRRQVRLTRASMFRASCTHARPHRRWGWRSLHSTSGHSVKYQPPPFPSTHAFTSTLTPLLTRARRLRAIT